MTNIAQTEVNTQKKGGGWKVLLGSVMGGTGAIITTHQINQRAIQSAQNIGSGIHKVLVGADVLHNMSQVADSSLIPHTSKIILSEIDQISKQYLTSKKAKGYLGKIQDVLNKPTLKVNAFFSTEELKNYQGSLNEASVNLKAQSEEFFKKLTGSSLQNKEEIQIANEIQEAMKLTTTQKLGIVVASAAVIGGAAYALHKRKQRKESYAEQLQAEQQVAETQERLR